MIFKAVGDGRPYPDHGLTTPKQCAVVPPRHVRLVELVTTKRTLDLDAPDAIRWRSSVADLSTDGRFRPCLNTPEQTWKVC